VKNWYRIEGGRKYFADFPEKGLMDFSLTSGGVYKWMFGGLKIKTTIQL
jgi:hypothetical protein